MTIIFSPRGYSHVSALIRLGQGRGLWQVHDERQKYIMTGVKRAAAEYIIEITAPHDNRTYAADKKFTLDNMRSKADEEGRPHDTN